MANLIEILLKSNSGQVTTELGKVDKALGKTEKQVKDAKSSTDKLAGSFDGFAEKLTVVAGVIALAEGIKYVVESAAEAELVQAQLNAVLKSTGEVAGMTSGDLNTLADDLAQLTGVDDELILKQEAVMLTFTKVSKEVFPDAIKAALNLSAAYGQDLQSSIIMIGKALNDPIQGVTALRRVGVMLTEQQEDQIRTLVEQNDLYGAQQIILEELNTEVGGAAEAMGDTFTGSVNKAKIAIGNLGEAIGNTLLPILRDSIDEVTELINKWTYAIVVEQEINQAVEDGIVTRREANDIINKYTWTTMSAAEAEEWLNEKVNEGAIVIDESARAMDDRWQSIEANREAMGYLADEEAKLAAQEQLLKETMDELGTVMAGRLGNEMDNYADKLVNIDDKLKETQETIDEHIEKIGELNEELRGEDSKDARKRIKEQIEDEKEKVAELRDEYSELENSIKDVADEHALATRRIIFDILQQQLAMDGLTQAEADALVSVAGKWGLIDKETQDAWNAISTYIESLEGTSVTAEGVEDAINAINGGEPMMEFNTQVEDVNTTLSDTETASNKVGDALVTAGDKSEDAIDGVIKKVDELQDKLDKMSSRAYSLDFQTSTPAPTSFGNNPFYDLLGQQGITDFVVPPGFSEPYNPFTIGASSGEVVNISSNGSPGNGITINVYADQIANDIDVERLAYRVASIVYEKQHGG